jgi:uncharacterized membrane protein
LLALAASFFSALNGIVFIFLQPAGFGALQCVFYRLVILGLAMAVWIKVKGQNIVCTNPFVWLGSVLWTLQVLLFYEAISFSYVYADVVTITFLSIALIAIFGWLILGEKCDIIDFVLIIFIIIGSATVVQPEFLIRTLGGADNSMIPERCYEPIIPSLNNYRIGENSGIQLGRSEATTALGDDVTNVSTSISRSKKYSNNITDILIPLRSSLNLTEVARPPIKCNRMLSALFATLSTIGVSFWYVVARKTKEVFHGTVVLYNCVIGVAISSGVATILGVWTFPLKVTPWLWMLAFSVSGGLGFVLKILAFQHEKAAAVATIKSSQIVFSYILGITILHEVPTALSGVGAVTVFVTCTIFCIRRLWNDDKNNQMTTTEDEDAAALLEDDISSTEE